MIHQNIYRYKIIIAYDGTDYYGWQEQLNHSSIVQTMRDAYRRIFGQPCGLLGASRTDAGVHALKQVALLRTTIPIAPEKIIRAWNNVLPSTIVIRSVEHAQPLFHPHHNIIHKTYVYHFFTQRPLPFVARYGWFYEREVDIEKLRTLLDVFVGTYDFSLFFSGKPIGNDPVCTINSITLDYIKRFDVYRLTFNGNRFMRHMVRRLVGILLYAASDKKISKEHITSLLIHKHPRIPFETAPAHGLLLYTILYKVHK